MKKTAALYIIFSLANIVALFWLVYFDMIEWLLKVDITYLSFLIIGLYVITSFFLRKEANSTKPLSEKFDVHMYVASNLTAVGLLGTVIGLMIAVYAMSGLAIDVENQKSIIDLMQKMFNALGTSLITTIVGLICSLLLKLQIVTLNTVMKNETE